MEIIFDCIVALLISGALVTLIHVVRTVMRMPVPKTDGARLFTVIAVRGDAPQLEQTVDALIWLKTNGTLSGDVIIADCGLAPDARKVAELLARDSGCVSVCPLEQISREVGEWMKENISK